MRLLPLLVLSLAACNLPSAAHSGPMASEAVHASTLPAVVDVVAFHPIWEEGEGVFLDVRTAEEFAAGHVPGAVLLPVQELMADVSKASAWQDQTIYVYCRTSNRSGVAASLLRDVGFERVVQVRGGYSAWSSKGYPSER